MIKNGGGGRDKERLQDGSLPLEGEGLRRHLAQHLLEGQVDRGRVRLRVMQNNLAISIKIISNRNT